MSNGETPDLPDYEDTTSEQEDSLERRLRCQRESAPSPEPSLHLQNWVLAQAAQLGTQAQHQRSNSTPGDPPLNSVARSSSSASSSSSPSSSSSSPCQNPQRTINLPTPSSASSAKSPSSTSSDPPPSPSLERSPTPNIFDFLRFERSAAPSPEGSMFTDA